MVMEGVLWILAQYNPADRIIREMDAERDRYEMEMRLEDEASNRRSILLELERQGELQREQFEYLKQQRQQERNSRYLKDANERLRRAAGL